MMDNAIARRKEMKWMQSIGIRGIKVDFFGGDKQMTMPVSYTHLTLDVIPLYVKAGSIIPVGPQVQYATEKPWDHLELKVYAGANGN